MQINTVVKPDKKSSVKKKRKSARKAPRRQPSFTRQYKRGDGLIHIPNTGKQVQQPVPASKIQKGLRGAWGEIVGILDQFEDVSERWSTSRIGFEVSFSADGKFLGVGVGGATSINVEFSSKDDDE